MNIYYHIRNWFANLLGYRQGLIFRYGVPYGIRVGFHIKRHGVITAKVKRPVRQGQYLDSDDVTIEKEQ